jgi:hypothetical protein
MDLRVPWAFWHSMMALDFARQAEGIAVDLMIPFCRVCDVGFEFNLTVKVR